MSVISLLGLAAGLAMDAFAVAISCGMSAREHRLRRALVVAAWFGAFQALMPLAGWMAGSLVRGWLSHFDHWAAFLILLFVGAKMIRDGMRRDESGSVLCVDLTLRALFLLSVATSMDALAVGLSMSFVDAPLVSSVVVIGIVTFLLSFIGCRIGNALGRVVRKKAHVFGGLMLIGIGLGVLIEHSFK